MITPLKPLQINTLIKLSLLSSDSDEDELIGPKLSEAKEPEPLTRDENLKKDAPVREWDKGKKGESFCREQAKAV